MTIQAQILDLMRDLRTETGTAILLITHDMGVIAEMADNVAVMYAGQIVEYTDVQTLFETQLHPYTEGLLAAIPVLGEVTRHLAVIPGSVPNLINLPPGCKFSPRCPYASDLCAGDDPTLARSRARPQGALLHALPRHRATSGPASARPIGTSSATKSSRWPRHPTSPPARRRSADARRRYFPERPPGRR